MRPVSSVDAIVGKLLSTTTLAWRRVDMKAVDQPTEEAVAMLCDLGLLEVRIVASLKMGREKTPTCRYIGGGPWWTLIEGELDRLIPATWLGSDGKPKKYLVQHAQVTAIRLTGAGWDHNAAAKASTLPDWWESRPEKIAAYLRPDGVSGNTTPDGPKPPDGFRFAGKVHPGLAPRLLKALQACWKSRSRAASRADLAEALHGDGADEMIVDEVDFKRLRRDLNAFFRDKGIGYHARVKRFYLVIDAGPPRKR